MKADLAKSFTEKKLSFNFNDIVFLLLLSLIVSLLSYGWHEMHSIYNPENINISLNYQHLPYYTLRTTMRLLIGLVFSLIFAVSAGAIAAKYKPIRYVMLPFVNFMESVPLVGFLTFTTIYFLTLFPHSIMGLECAAIFGVFTGQAWNMMLAVYQTLRIVPTELIEAANVFGYNGWQRFWRLEFPYTIPGLLWNTMVSQSSAWFALVASEAIPIKDKTVALPGVGSYIATALTQGNLLAIIYAILALIVNIVILDQLLFRPLVKWSAQFKYEDLASINQNTSWCYNCMTHSSVCQYIKQGLTLLMRFFVYTLPIFCRYLQLDIVFILARLNSLWAKIWYFIIISACIFYGIKLWEFFPHHDLVLMPNLMLLTAVRVFIAMILSVLFFVPLGVWIGMTPKMVRVFQPIIQILAALPSNIFYPIMAVYLITFQQNLNWWSIILIMLGTQWYILFNVIAGVTTIPNQLTEVSTAFRVTGFMWWQKFMLPAIFPYIVTGIISAAGGAWNATITSEVLQWGTITKSANGLGAYIANATNNAHNPEAALGCVAMCAMVALCIIFIWHPLYNLAENRFKVS
jgi:NitT/TauT family transport system permease protein